MLDKFLKCDILRYNYVDWEIKEFPITLSEAIKRDAARNFVIG